MQELAHTQAEAQDGASDALARALAPGEQVLMQIECLRKLRLQLFEHTVVVLTPARLLVFGPTFPWGWELKHAHDRAGCGVVNGKERSDGSRLMILRTSEGPLCLYFKRAGAAAADLLLEAVGSAAPAPVKAHPAKPPHSAAARPSPRAITRFEEELALIPTEPAPTPAPPAPAAVAAASAPAIDPFEVGQELHAISEPVQDDDD